MQALIDPKAQVQYISAWTTEVPYEPIYATYPNGERVCQVADVSFPVAQPLFWVDCENDVLADQFYYDSSDKTIKPIDNAPYPGHKGLQTV
jgi:hypothetical protein